MREKGPFKYFTNREIQITSFTYAMNFEHRINALSKSPSSRYEFVIWIICWPERKYRFGGMLVSTSTWQPYWHRALTRALGSLMSSNMIYFFLIPERNSWIYDTWFTCSQIFYYIYNLFNYIHCHASWQVIMLDYKYVLKHT